MILHPDVRTPVLKAWGAFTGTVLLCGGLLAWLADPGDLPNQVESSATKAKSLSGPVDLAQRIAERKAANQHLATTIEALKVSTGFTARDPFVVPPGTRQPGQYFNEQLLLVQDRLRAQARERSVAYQERLGFDLKAEVPADSEAPYLLTMLQLTEKLATIVLKAPSTPVIRFTISQPERAAVVTGPTERPPLLKEYPLTLKVQGGLSDVLAILHRLALVESNGYPLTVRRFQIASKNLESKDDIQQLDAEIEVAGLQFLSETERATAVARPRTGLGGR